MMKFRGILFREPYGFNLAIPECMDKKKIGDWVTTDEIFEVLEYSQYHYAIAKFWQHFVGITNCIEPDTVELYYISYLPYSEHKIN